MKILRLVDKDTYVSGLNPDINGLPTEVAITFNVFKAKDITETDTTTLQYIKDWVREHEGTLLEIVEIL